MQLVKWAKTAMSYLIHCRSIDPTAVIVSMLQTLVIALGAGAIGFFILRSYFVGLLEPPIAYKVPIPAICLEKETSEYETVEETSIHISGSSLIQCYCPANGRALGWVNPHTAEGIDRAISKAEEAQRQWATTTFSQRRQVLRSLLKHILDNQDPIVRAACLDSGKTRVDASFGEVLVTAEKLKWTIEHGEQALRPDSRGTSLLMMYKKNEVRYEPLGVVAACVSWNYPFHNLLNGIISSIFAGNAIIVKGSEQTAWSAQYFVSIVRGALSACGHSPALVQSVICWPTVASYLTSHPSIRHLTFIGSRPVAHAVAASAAKSLTALCVELGGKDAAIVLDDVGADVSRIVSILMRGVFQSAGQNCIGIERVIATPKAFDTLVKLLLPRIKALRVGSALDDEENVDVGACISDAGFDRLEQLIQDAKDKGAQLLCGGSRFTHPTYPKGHFFAPTLLVGVTMDMAIAQQELFAPIFVLMRANSVQDAVTIANSTPYGLGASVFGRSAANLDLVTRRLEVGMVAVNDFAAYYMCSLPFGGVKGSGYGRFGGAEGLRAVCNAKSVCRDRTSLIKTSIPPRLDYPSGTSTQSDSKAKAWMFVKGIVELGYGIDVAAKAEGIVKLILNG